LVAVVAGEAGTTLLPASELALGPIVEARAV
jgi:hypothetical protein